MRWQRDNVGVNEILMCPDGATDPVTQADAHRRRGTVADYQPKFVRNAHSTQTNDWFRDETDAYRVYGCGGRVAPFAAKLENVETWDQR